tara:strand:+ start:202 stop:1377 length:1176 start_codon:yes stop_codon:yes gene_type:complete
MVSKALEKKRVKGRKNRVTIEDKYLGQEPWWDEDNPPPTDKGPRMTQWTKAAHWYNYFYKAKDYVPYVIRYAQEVHGLTKDDITAIKALPDWKINYSVNAVARLHFRGWNHEQHVHDRLFKILKEKAIAGKEILKTKKETAATAPPPISPAQRAYNNMIETVHADWDDKVVDSWIDGNFKPDFNVYEIWKSHGLKGNVINAFKEKVQYEYDIIADSYHKKCDQAMEAYSHISLRNQKKMLQTMETIFDDLEKLRSSFRAVKMPRAKKPKASDAQVAHLQYKPEDIESKVTSINPVLIPGKEMLFVYNTKQRVLTQYVTTATKGFEVGGTSIKNYEPTLSKTTKLRKPEDILPEVLKLTPKQIEKRVWDKLTTKINSPAGRINKDCVLLRVV